MSWSLVIWGTTYLQWYLSISVRWQGWWASGLFNSRALSFRHSLSYFLSLEWSSSENLCTSYPGILEGFKDLSVLPSFRLDPSLYDVLFGIVATPSSFFYFLLFLFFLFFILSIIIHIVFLLLLHCEPARAVRCWAVLKLN